MLSKKQMISIEVLKNSLGLHLFTHAEQIFVRLTTSRVFKINENYSPKKGNGDLVNLLARALNYTAKHVNNTHLIKINVYCCRGETPGTGVLIRRATEEDEERVFQYLLEHFYLEEPLNGSVGRLPDCKANCPALDFLKQNLSFIAVEETSPNVICGLALNQGETIIDNGHDMWTNIQNPNANYVKVVTFLRDNKKIFLEKIRKTWPDSQGEKAIDISILSVRKENRRQRLGNQLMEMTIAKAREMGFRFITIECSSAYSAAMANKHGFTAIHKVPFHEYLDENNQIIFNTTAPHLHFACYVKEIIKS